MMAFFLAAFVGPGQVSPDLANNALPLYLARPFSRAEYVLGKMSVLLILMSHHDLDPRPAALRPARLPGRRRLDRPEPAHRGGIFFGAWIWILLLSLLALALSAWVKWKPMAGALLFGVFFVAADSAGHQRRAAHQLGQSAQHQPSDRHGLGVAVRQDASRQRRGLLPRARTAKRFPCGAAGAAAGDLRPSASICWRARFAARSPMSAMSASPRIVFDNVSRFYGEVLGVNRVNLSIPPGITSLVGPNGSGKTTLMNLMTGLIRPTRGEIRVLGISRTAPKSCSAKWATARSSMPFPKDSPATNSSIRSCWCTA
jgi:ABC-type multidrug transport system fused ATPase/permease subunit